MDLIDEMIIEEKSNLLLLHLLHYAVVVYTGVGAAAEPGILTWGLKKCKNAIPKKIMLRGFNSLYILESLLLR